ncbi:hypothetical protein PFISCL1PPCAC_23740, partial [Pristionchus fissidentatus]
RSLSPPSRHSEMSSLRNGIQDFALIDYLAPVILGAIFALGAFILSCAANYLYINKDDELTVYEKFGAKRNFRLGRPLHKVKKLLADKIIAEDEDYFIGEKTILTK